MGKVADWRVANWGRGRTLKAITPATKDWGVLVSGYSGRGVNEAADLEDG